MAQIVIRRLDEAVKTRLSERASAHGWSMEEEARQILRNALQADQSGSMALGSRIAERFSDEGLDSELPEFHGEAAPMELGD